MIGNEPRTFPDDRACPFSSRYQQVERLFYSTSEDEDRKSLSSVESTGNGSSEPARVLLPRTLGAFRPTDAEHTGARGHERPHHTGDF